MRATSSFVFILMTVIALPLAATDPSLDFLNRILSGAETEAGKNVQRLSSGRDLLADDPAGYAVDQTLEKYIRGLDRMILNRTDMISYYNVEDGMLATIIDTLQRIRDLASQRMDGILSDDDRAAIDAEISQEYDQILFTLSTAEFNTKRIFSDLADSPAVKERLSDSPHQDLNNIDSLLRYFISERGVVSALAAGLQFSIQGDAAAAENMTAARTAEDTSFGAEASALKRNQLLMLVNLLMLKQNLP